MTDVEAVPRHVVALLASLAGDPTVSGHSRLKHTIGYTAVQGYVLLRQRLPAIIDRDELLVCTKYIHVCFEQQCNGL